VVHITGHNRIAAPLEQESETVADSRNRPSFNLAMTDVELLKALDSCASSQTRRWLGATR
jgi:hypothetical protein